MGDVRLADEGDREGLKCEDDEDDVEPDECVLDGELEPNECVLDEEEVERVEKDIWRELRTARLWGFSYRAVGMFLQGVRKTDKCPHVVLKSPEKSGGCGRGIGSKVRPMAPPPIQFWFDFASTYSYVAAARIGPAAAAMGARVEWKPFLLGPIFHEQQGLKDSPFNVQPVRGRYMWRDLERLCEKYRLPWTRPSAFPRNSILALRVALLGADAAWGPRFVVATYEANFAHDQNIGDPAVLGDILRGLGQDASALLERATEPANKERLKRQTDEAVRAGIFGAPDFLVGGELFFGHDRMDDALAWWTRRA